MSASTAAERLSQLGYDLVETRLIGLDPSMGYVEYIVRGRRRSDGRYAVWYGIDWTRHPDAGDRANGFTVNQGAYDLTAAESRDEAKRREKMDSRFRWESPSGKAKGKVSSGASKPAQTSVRYGWEFPDGTVIPADDSSAIESKLLSMDSFWEKNRDACLRDGLFYEWYDNDVDVDIEYMDTPEMRDYYGVKVVYPEGKGDVTYVLPDGRKVNYDGLFRWIEGERYTFEDWYRYNYDCPIFKEIVEIEAEYLSEDPSEEAMEYYGVRRVAMGSASPKRSAKSKVKPKAKSPARKPVSRIASKASKPKSPARKPTPKVPSKASKPKSQTSKRPVSKSKGARR